MRIQKLIPTVVAPAVIIGAASALPTPFVRGALAQTTPTISNVVPESVAVSIHAKIQAIDPATRRITLSGRSGNSVTVTAGPLVRLEMLKIGDTVNAKYYRSVAFALTPPRGGDGTPQSDDQMAQLVAQRVDAPGGVGVRLTKVSGLVVGIDTAAHSIDIVDPSGGAVYTIDVIDPARIALIPKLKVGDTVTAVVSQALAVSVEPAPKSWF